MSSISYRTIYRRCQMKRPFAPPASFPAAASSPAAAAAAVIIQCNNIKARNF